MQIIKTQKKSNGCGFGFTSKFLPDLEFGGVCDTHDIETDTGGGLIDYVSINVNFYADLLFVIVEKRRSVYERTLMFLYATFMGIYVLFFNWLFFNWRVA